jgi:hypothetical protein
VLLGSSGGQASTGFAKDHQSGKTFTLIWNGLEEDRIGWSNTPTERVFAGYRVGNKIGQVNSSRTLLS